MEQRRISNQLTNPWGELHYCVARNKNGWSEVCDYELTSPWNWSSYTDNSTYAYITGINNISEAGVDLDWTINYSLKTSTVNEIKIYHHILRTSGGPAWTDTYIKYWSLNITIDGDWENDTMAIIDNQSQLQTYNLNDTSLNEEWNQGSLNERKYTLDDLPGGKFGWTRWSENKTKDGVENSLDYNLTVGHPGTGIDNNSRINLTLITGAMNKDNWVSLELWWRDPPTRLFDEIEEPCTTDYTTPNDRCKALEVNENDTVNVTFHYVHTGNKPETYNQTLNLVYGSSKHPHKNNAGTDIPYTSDCTGNTIILKNVYNTTCTGFGNCIIEANGDVRLLGTSYRTDYEANITYEIEFCPGTLGNSYNVWNKQIIDADGAVKSDSFVLFDINPIEMWNSTTGNVIYSSPAVADVNSDSFIETIIGSNDGYVYAFNGTTGEQVWNYSTGFEIYSSPSIADINNDNILEVVIGAFTSDYTNGGLYALNGTNGVEIWSYDNVCVGSSPTLIDLDQDAVYREVIFGACNDDYIYVLNGTNGSQIWNYSTGVGATYTFWLSSPAAADFHADSGYEFILGDYNGTLYAMNSTGGLLWSFVVTDPEYSAIDSSPAIEDINNDSIDEVVFASWNGKIYALNTSDGTHLWNYSTGTSIMSSPVIYDINNDTNLEIIIGSNSFPGVIYAFNGTGSQVWNYTVYTKGRADSSPAIEDINNDTYPDVIFGGSDNNVFAINGLDGTLIWNYTLDSYVYGSPAIEDLNGDNHLDIVASVLHSYKIYALDPPGGYGKAPKIDWVKSMEENGCGIEQGDEEWKMFGANFRRTRLLDRTAPQNEEHYTKKKKKEITVYSFWRDLYTNLGFAVIVENSTGEWLTHEINVKGTNDWVTYSFPAVKKEVIKYTIFVGDSQNNINCIDGKIPEGKKK